jgi:hypothetical protein
MDFYTVKERSTKNGVIEVYPDFRVIRSKDLMIRGKSFYAIWDEELGLWSTDEYDVQRLVDDDLLLHKEEMAKRQEGTIQTKLLGEFSSNSWLQFRNYVGHVSDSSHQLDESLTFSNTEVKKNNYVSRRLPYPLVTGDISAYDEMMSTLYLPEERAKLEWAVGAVVSGDSKDIQKFIVLYGIAGSGKGTFINIVQKLFAGYYTTFEAKALTASNNAFSTEVFKENPLVAIQHDGDLSKIEDNSKLNSIISHEEMTFNEKYKPAYTSKVNCFLFMGTNKPVKITDAKSGIIRRLIDVRPSGQRVPTRRYQALNSQMDFELGAIASHCLGVYRSMGKDYYSGYRPLEMMLQTDVFFNYIEEYYDVFKEQNGCTLQQAYEMYKTYCDESNIEFKLPRFKFREELRNYFGTFEERAIVNGVRVRSWYTDFLTDHFTIKPKEEAAFPLVLDQTDSAFDTDCSDQPAQYATSNETPIKKWKDISSTLSEIDTTKLHYVKPPLNHIVIDFDLKDENGEKSAERNLEAASRWPSTYAEYSKSGHGIHLHYIYDGDPTELSRVYDDNIEVKVFVGDGSLRRKLSKCNNVPVATINTGLPLKEKKMINPETIKSERALRDLILRNLNKEIHPGTKPSVDFIHKILQDAYDTGLVYDLTDMRPRILAFANNSTNQALLCIKTVQSMQFKSETRAEEVEAGFADDRFVFFDVEVFKNLFLICWKYQGDSELVRMVNPTPQEVEEFLKLKLIGYNNRRYDNHIVYARYMGYSNEQLYKLSKKIIDNTPGALFGEAYDVSYADIYDFSSKKQGLKKFQLELGIHHKELGFDWDEPVPEELWGLVGDYCDNDVTSEEAVFDARKQDFIARQILSELSGLPVNSSTQQHTAKIIFNGDRRPQDKFVYTDLSEMFPGYVYEAGVSTYKGEITGEGGYVYAEPGMYTNVAVLDVESMHPTSIEVLDAFGPYTKTFSSLKAARIAIKHKDYASAKKMLGGILSPHLKSEDDAEALSYALKIVINIVYGLTSAKFDNPFRDPRNKDNIVAKRGALFMIDLKHFVQEQGFQVVHIKTDSIKIPEATPEIIDLVMEFGYNYGYNFEHECTYEKFCLVNDAVYIARLAAGQTPAHWEATGAQFGHPYVFKTLFSKEPIEFDDMCETKTVQSALYLDFNNDDRPMALRDPLHFVGRAGSFCPIKPDHGGGLLMREKDGKYYAAAGTKGYRWQEAEVVKELNQFDAIDDKYFKKLCDAAIDNVSKFGDFEWFTSDLEAYIITQPAI